MQPRGGGKYIQKRNVEVKNQWFVDVFVPFPREVFSSVSFLGVSGFGWSAEHRNEHYEWWNQNLCPTWKKHKRPTHHNYSISTATNDLTRPTNWHAVHIMFLHVLTFIPTTSPFEEHLIRLFAIIFDCFAGAVLLWKIPLPHATLHGNRFGCCIAWWYRLVVHCSSDQCRHTPRVKGIQGNGCFNTSGIEALRDQGPKNHRISSHWWLRGDPRTLTESNPSSLQGPMILRGEFFLPSSMILYGDHHENPENRWM